MAKKKKRPAADKQEILVNVVLDRSGSMGMNRAGTISGYNEYLAGLRADKATKYSVSLIQFDAPLTTPELTVSYTDRPLSDVDELTSADYEPRGMTPLYDAIGECIRRVVANGRGVLTVVITDGLENASQEFTQGSIKKLIQEKEAEGWKFAFLGANIDSFEVGGSIGVAATATANYTPGMERAMFANLAQSTNCYASNVRGHGVHVAASKSLFDDKQRAEMAGGAAPKRKPFQPTGKPRTQWSVRS